jgi:hypothetical protein
VPPPSASVDGSGTWPELKIPVGKPSGRAPPALMAVPYVASIHACEFAMNCVAQNLHLELSPRAIPNILIARGGIRTAAPNRTRSFKKEFNPAKRKYHMSASVPAPRIRSLLGGCCAVLIGLLNVVIILYFVNAPAAGRDDPNGFFQNFANYALRSSLPWIVFALTAVLSYAVLPVVHESMREIHPDWARFATIVGLVEYTVQGVWAITLTRAAPSLSATFQSGNEITRSAILAVGLPQIDPDGWFSFGGPGLWMIVVNTLAIQGRRLPPWRAVLGILAGICAWATVFASLFPFEPLNLFASASGAVVYPLWFVLLGVRMIKGFPAAEDASR